MIIEDKSICPKNKSINGFKIYLFKAFTILLKPPNNNPDC